jgi:hypothetical protein
MSKSIRLVLGSGGARGLAHIGAIREIEKRGYEIKSVIGVFRWGNRRRLLLRGQARQVRGMGVQPE